MTLNRWTHWIGEDDPVSHFPLSKDYASQRNLRGFLSKIYFLIIKGGAKKQPKVQGGELLFSPAMKTLDSILVNVCSK